MQITINNYGGNITISEVPKKSFDPRSTLLSRMYYKSVCLKCLNMIKAGDC